MKNNKTLTITLSALAFLVLSAGTAYAANVEGFQKRFRELTEGQISIIEQAGELKQNGNFEEAHNLLSESGIGMLNFHHSRGFSDRMMQNRDDIREAVENNDYNAFLSLVEDSPRHIEISEDDFNRLVEAHALRIEGDFEGAREIMDELGFSRGPRFGRSID